MEILYLVITKNCDQLVNEMFLGPSIEHLEKKALELRENFPLKDALVEGFVYVPVEGFIKALQVAF